MAAAAAADPKSQQLKLSLGSNLDEVQLSAIASLLMADSVVPKSDLLAQLSSDSQLSFDEQTLGASPMLHAYLRALYAFKQSRKRPTETLSVTGTNSSMASAGALFGPAPGSSSSAHMIGLAAALLSAFLIVKLVMRSSDKQILKRLGSSRQFWTRNGSSSPATEAGQLSGPAAMKAAEAANCARPPVYSACVDGVELESSGSECKNKVELLIDRVASLLSRKSAKKQQQESQVSSKGERVSEELDEASLLTEASAVNQPGRFRTSRSYIKSLVEALSKARAQFPAVNLLSGSGYASAATPLDDDELTCGGALSDGSQTDLEADSNEPGIMVSQMDISAAHLILSYMEKHLEDKEQLQREWRELQMPAGSCPAEATGCGGAVALEKLAKVALEEDNKHKNRNNLVVPYDRNRVKLGAYCSTRRRSAKPASLGASCKSDYINASYIYDDEPRKPTHIITQGPSEQTVPQFWQVSRDSLLRFHVGLL